MNLKEWALAQGVHPVTAYRWFREGRLPIPARKVGRLILVDPEHTAAPGEIPVLAAALVAACARAYGPDAAATCAHSAIGEAVRDAT